MAGASLFRISLTAIQCSVTINILPVTFDLMDVNLSSVKTFQHAPVHLILQASSNAKRSGR